MDKKWVPITIQCEASNQQLFLVLQPSQALKPRMDRNEHEMMNIDCNVWTGGMCKLQTQMSKTTQPWKLEDKQILHVFWGCMIYLYLQFIVPIFSPNVQNQATVPWRNPILRELFPVIWHNLVVPTPQVESMPWIPEGPDMWRWSGKFLFNDLVENRDDIWYVNIDYKKQSPCGYTKNTNIM